MKAKFIYIVFVVILSPICGSAYSQESNELSIEIYLRESDNSKHIEIARELAKSPISLKAEIIGKIASIKSGKDIFSPKNFESLDSKPALLPGGALYHLGRLAESLEDPEFSHQIWRQVAEITITNQLDFWSTGSIAEKFLAVATQSDIELVEKFALRNEPSIAKLARVAKRRLKNGKSGGEQEAPEPKSITTAPKTQANVPTPEPTFAVNPPTPDKKATEPEAGGDEADSNPFPYWIFMIGGVVLAGLVVLLRRK